jgi:tetratricopeptide (TPR) repeat protein
MPKDHKPGIPRSARARNARPRQQPTVGQRNHLGDEMHDYSQRDLARLFHLNPTLIRSLAAAGYVTPTSDVGRTSYSFQDLLTFRMASALKAAKIPSAKITLAMGKIRGALPPGAVLTSLALAASGKELAVRRGSQEWEPISGQYALPLARDTKTLGVTSLTLAARPLPLVEAQAHYARGHALEETDVVAARAAYLAALDAHKDHLEARINLGRLLHLDGELTEAERVYRQARSSSALLSFNLAILLEDLNREQEAITAYREALAQDPKMHDAHFNLSRLHEQANQPREALRHLLAYRRHIAKFGH